VGKGITENEFQSQVIEAAQYLGYRVAHFRGVRIQRKDGSVYYQTPVQADGKGFPDLILIRGCVILAVELKSEKGRVTSAQEEWLSAFKEAGVATFVFRPSDWEDIVRCLSNDSKTTNKIQGMCDMPSSIPD